MGLRAVAIVVHNTTGQPVTGASVTLANFGGLTNEDGYILFTPITAPQQAVLSVSASGYQDVTASVRINDTNQTFRLGNTSGDPQDTHLPALEPHPPAFVPIYPKDTGFVTSMGDEWVWAMMTGFSDYQLFLQGKDITPQLQEAQALGARGRRVFGMMHYLTHFYPQDYGHTYYDALPAFLELNARFGQYVDFNIFADAQMVNIPQHAHFDRVCDAVRGHLNLVVSLGNEYPKNGFDPRQFVMPSGILCSNGSGLADAPPVLPGWWYHEWHGRRDWPKVTSSSEDMWYVSQGAAIDGRIAFPRKPIVHTEPIGFHEVFIEGRRSNDPKLARQIGASCRVLGAGGTFHCEDGMFSQLLRPIQQACATAFFSAFT